MPREAVGVGGKHLEALAELGGGARKKIREKKRVPPDKKNARGEASRTASRTKGVRSPRQALDSYNHIRIL